MPRSIIQIIPAPRHMRIWFSIEEDLTNRDVVVEPACLALYSSDGISGTFVKPMVTNGNRIQFADEVSEIKNSGEIYKVKFKEMY